jgi:hypothetical protein
MTTPPFDTLFSAYESILLSDAHQAITQCELWPWLATYEPDEGFGFAMSCHPNLDRISTAMIRLDEHSGSSYGWTMRVMQGIAQRGWDTYRNEARQARAARALTAWAATQTRSQQGGPCPCRAATGKDGGWCGVAGGGVPGCEH